jgi:hypothetical protein
MIRIVHPYHYYNKWTATQTCQSAPQGAVAIFHRLSLKGLKCSRKSVSFCSFLKPKADIRCSMGVLVRLR